MDESVDLRAQAIELRRQGFSYSQIGRRLDIHKSVIARWLATVPFDGFNDESRTEQLSAVRDPGLYNRALELRQAGWSYKMIEAEIDVARSTLSGWLRNTPVADQHVIVRKARWEAAQLKAMQVNRLRREALAADIEAKAGQDIRELFVGGASNRDLFIIGLMLYWAEGAKTGSVVSVTNSDPFVIKAFVLWLRQCLAVDLDQLRGEVHLYPDIDVNEAEAYWSEVIGIPRAQFYKAQVDRRMDKSLDKRGKLKHGTVHVKVLGRGTSNKLRKILAWIGHLHVIIEDATRE
jgi:orotate phosphoribosyltransferase-like protein